MKKLLLLTLPLAFIGLTGCETIVTSTTIDSAYEGGKEGNEDSDLDPDYGDDTALTDLFTRVASITSYSYQLEMNLASDESTFTQYFSPNAWYVDYGADSNVESFGYAQELNTHEVFKYYLEGEDIYPSVYEYGGYDELEPLTSLYSWITVATTTMIADTLDTLTYIRTSLNRYALTDTDTMSIFQYMTTYGSSITNYINACYIHIDSLEENRFTTTIDLGDYGSIRGIYTPLDTASNPVSVVNEAVLNGLEGVASNPKVAEAASLINNNNYRLRGINVSSSSEPNAYQIDCTNDYFYFQFQGEYAEEYPNFGYAFLKGGQTIPVIENGVRTEYNLNYDAFFSFALDENGEFYFDQFAGPIESGGSYLKVDSFSWNRWRRNSLYRWRRWRIQSLWMGHRYRDWWG